MHNINVPAVYRLLKQTLLQCSMFVISVCSGSAPVVMTTPSMQAEDSHIAASSIKFIVNQVIPHTYSSRYEEIREGMHNKTCSLATLHAYY